MSHVPGGTSALHLAPACITPTVVTVLTVTTPVFGGFQILNTLGSPWLLNTPGSLLSTSVLWVAIPPLDLIVVVPYSYIYNASQTEVCMLNANTA